jgi:transcriptional regulator with XRE-family HTH domain
MSIRAERIKLLIEQSGKTYQELETITGIKKSSLQRYASGVTAKIPLNAIEQLSKTFNVSQEYLMGWTEETEEKKEIPGETMQLTEDERKFIELFRQIPEDQQKVFLEMGRVYANSLKKD